jgi:hypothetical protein
MTLLEIRTQFIKESGRYDLVVNTTTFADNGADYYIRAGQRFLDGLYDNRKSKKELVVSIGDGQTELQLTGVSSVEDVLCKSATGSSYLTRHTITSLREKYGYQENCESTIEKDQPIDYAIGVGRSNSTLFPDVQANAVRLMFMPPADGDYRLVITARAYAERLSDDESINFWSEQFPHTLIQAAHYMLERAYRNTEGANDHLRAIMEDIRLIDQEVVDQESINANQMKDSW